MHNPSGVAQRLNDLENDADLEFEILQLRSCSEEDSDELPRDCRGICGEDRPCRVAPRLDKHRLDVALSAGRHAAERAKLAGVIRLIAMAPSVSLLADCRPPATGADARGRSHDLPCLGRCFPEVPACFDPYDALGCRGRPEIAALVGVAIAAAQMGIPFCLPDPAGGVVLEAAVGLNPGVRAWLDPIPADSPGSIPVSVRPRSLCAV
ncbi:hypothetical protein [Thiocapsa sp.]|uniref:hypothetical protein n=1 Tax=Thiocapsa sp. TaxID=2024551 RepID=UPI002600FB64|nr:hypothetical protein [Thiocapsa sp.]